MCYGNGCSCDSQKLEGDGVEEDEIAAEDFHLDEESDLEIDHIPLCGDGSVDEGEECDDHANGDPNDGCTDDCLFSCHDDSECLDDEICNGDESCNLEQHVCEEGIPREDGYVCNEDPRMICMDGECQEGCIDCWVCLNDEDCPDDGNVCNGEEYCDVGESMCDHRNPLPEGTPCDDADPCTYPDICQRDGICVGTPSNIYRGVSAGISHTCALRDTGSARCWGYNASGQLGNGTRIHSALPVDVLDLASSAAAIAAGGNHSCVLLVTGCIQCWGFNGVGQLGDGTSRSRTTPVDVSGLPSGVLAIDAGDIHTCALLVTGGVKCWGNNASGQLGDGTNLTRTSPVDVIGLTSGVTAIAADRYHTCALLDTGVVECWGSNVYGQLGDGTTDGSNVPVMVSGLSSVSSAIVAGGRHSCAILDTGEMMCWGGNHAGPLGDGSTTDRVTPGNVSGLGSGVSVITAGYAHTCAVLDTGTIRCWGTNYYGTLGDGTTDNRLLPVSIECL